MLSGAWRETADSTSNFSAAQLAAITPRLCHSGAAALAWWQIRNTPLATTTAGQELREVYRRFRLSALIHEREIAYVWSLLRDAGIEAMLVKGWAIAHRYPDRALRPYGDIDICVRPDQFTKAAAALKCLEKIDGHYVDLHAGFANIGRGENASLAAARNAECAGKVKRRRRFGLVSENNQSGVAHSLPPHAREDSIFARTQLVDLDGTQVRILSDEDHLRVICLHLLRSGARGPKSLFDVAVLLEQVSSLKSQVMGTRGQVSEDVRHATDLRHLKPEFDWEMCLGSNPVDANWIATAVALAHELLGADISHTPFADHEAPRWLVAEVLEQWGGKTSPKFKAQNPKSVYPLKALDFGHWTFDWYRRWHNPIRATAAVGGQFNNWPRLPYQFAESILRLPELTSRF